MDLDLAELAEAVLRLPPADRAVLAARLLESLDPPAAGDTPDAVAAAWATELDRRDAEFEADPTLGIPAEEVFQRLERDLAARRARPEERR